MFEPGLVEKKHSPPLARPGLPWPGPKRLEWTSPTRPHLQQLRAWRQSRRCCSWISRASALSRESKTQWRSHSLATQDAVKLVYCVQLWARMCRALDNEGSLCGSCLPHRHRSYPLYIARPLVPYQTEVCCESELIMLKVAQVILDYIEQCMKNFVGLYGDE